MGVKNYGLPKQTVVLYKGNAYLKSILRKVLSDVLAGLIGLSWRTVQYMIKQGAITSIKFGDAWLINIDELYNYFTKAGKNE